MKTTTWRLPGIRTGTALLAAAGLITGTIALAPQLAAHHPSMSVLRDDTTSSNATVRTNGDGATVYAYPGSGTTLDISLPSVGTLADGVQVPIQCYWTATTPITRPNGEGNDSSDLYWDQIDTIGNAALSPMPAAGDVAVVPDAFLATSTPVNQMVPACSASGAVPTVSPTPTATDTASPSTSSPPVPPPPVPTAQPTSFQCRVDLRANYALGGPPARHMYIVYTDAIGRQSVFRGGPTTRNPGNFGQIVAVDRPYQPGALDWSTTDPSSTIDSGADACGRVVCFAGEVDRINRMNIPYELRGPNSNSVAYTILTNCGLPQPANPPFGYAPGWGTVL